MPDANPYYLNWLDSDGDFTKSNLWAPTGVTITDSSIIAVAAALDAISTARLFKHGILSEAPRSGPAATSGPYDAADKAVLQFRDEDGLIYSIMVPAPSPAVFLSDNETVDQSHARIVAAIAAGLAGLTTRAGIPMAAFVRGFRSRTTRRGQRDER